jgi:hypothetical protein
MSNADLARDLSRQYHSFIIMRRVTCCFFIRNFALFLCGGKPERRHVLYENSMRICKWRLWIYLLNIRFCVYEYVYLLSLLFLENYQLLYGSFRKISNSRLKLPYSRDQKQYTTKDVHIHKCLFPTKFFSTWIIHLAFFQNRCTIKCFKWITHWT